MPHVCTFYSRSILVLVSPCLQKVMNTQWAPFRRKCTNRYLYIFCKTAIFTWMSNGNGVKASKVINELLPVLGLLSPIHKENTRACSRKQPVIVNVSILSELVAPVCPHTICLFSIYREFQAFIKYKHIPITWYTPVINRYI